MSYYYFEFHSNPFALLQLFGDTVNVASVVQSKSARDKIHVSSEFAAHLCSHGKGHWVKPREDRVCINGRGDIETFHLKIPVGGKARSDVSSAFGDVDRFEDLDEGVAARNSEERLIDWNTEVLTGILKEIVAYRMSVGLPVRGDCRESEAAESRSRKTPLNLVQDFVEMPNFVPPQVPLEPDSVILDEVVLGELRKYVCTLAKTYQSNAFHNFEHASHVTNSVNKLFSRIVAPSPAHTDNAVTKSEKSLHDHTYGISSNPLTHQAAHFAALAHDADHTGVANPKLVEENPQLSQMYDARSVAEQNSFDIAWDILMDDTFKELRQIMYTTPEEFRRFQLLFVTSVLSTDIMDKGLKAKRNERWNLAFSETAPQQGVDNDRNRKALIVLEHLLQASDIAHTMQHWHIYIKWNRRLFQENLDAYNQGRAATHPAEGWYKGEIGFFDFYIIPLAKKLKDCGVFGVSSGEYLNYAMQNRAEWERRGQQIVEEYMQESND
jgi:hypothetical protein